MSEKEDSAQVREAIVEGLEKEDVAVGGVLSALKQTPLGYLDLVRESTAFIKELTTTETPRDPEEIKRLNKEQVIFATYRANFFEKIRMPVLDDNQLECLLLRSHELWGEYPTEPLGRWVDWCLWTHLDRRQNGVAITEVIAGNKTADDLKQAWIRRHQAREERRHLQKIDQYDRYDTSDDVPISIRQIVMSPFIEESEMAHVEIKESTDDSKERQKQA